MTDIFNNYLEFFRPNNLSINEEKDQQIDW